ncbi:ABC transporter substrate-binding protein [Gulosibacter macacae]|uniref:ABC transporter substrate-binding protein n=1 Tax=Gulosibacter macacae TaxID=2488791 RepID=A0A3P3W6Q8_9MICO|nr:ABC transporter substrate-binding protein [Gulosibacter macacae]RRJ88353.1 ABC transporter substrate-binding protein [Gulosibacter macacae]
MKNKRILAGAAAALAAALVLAGCSNGTGGTDAPAGTEGAATGGVILANSTEPQNPLIPTMTNEVGGGKVLDLINATLVYYDVDGNTVNELAESIEPNADASEWTIKIKPDQVFSDGSTITSDSFIDAWNYGANPANAQLSSYFFEPIQGYSAEEGANVETLSGLKKVDDSTFTVTLTGPTSDFGQRLGYSAFAPLPAVAFDDIAAYGEKPLASGPYMLAETGWEHNVKISLVPNPDYKGDRKPQNGGVDLIFYATQDAAYNDLLANNLDVLDQIPDSAFGTYESELADRSVNQPAAIFQSFAIPQIDHFQFDEEGTLRREAISMAINRAEVTDVVFQSTRTPAKDFTSPVIAGYNDSLPGSEVLNYDPEKAKELWAQADAINPWSGTFEIGYNSDGGHQAWVEAVTNQISNTLGIEAKGKPYAAFKELRDDVTSGNITTAFRTGWQADYPGSFNFLGPLYGTGAGSNDTKYSSQEFDDLIRQGNAATDIETANGFYDQAQSVLFKDLPVVPLWYANVTGGWSQNVDNVAFGWNSVPLYYEITKN